MRNGSFTRAAALLLLASAPALGQERIISKKAGEYWVQLTLRPGDPRPGRLIEVQVEVDKIPDFPDPIYGDRVPVPGANLVATVAPAMEGAGGKSRTYKLHPIGEGGVYGLHTIVETAGVYSITVAPREGAGPKASFDVGVGVPMATEAGEGKKGASRRPAAGAGGGRMVVSSVGPKAEMREIGERWAVLEMLAQNGAVGLGPAQAEAQLIANLLKKAKQKPPKSANPRDEFDALMDASNAEFTRVAREADFKKLPALVAATEQGCLKCHVKYRWEMTQDLSRWPKFEIAGRTK